MEGPVVPGALQAAWSAAWTPSAPERERINQIIFDSWCMENFFRNRWRILLK